MISPLLGLYSFIPSEGADQSILDMKLYNAPWIPIAILYLQAIFFMALTLRFEAKKFNLDAKPVPENASSSAASNFISNNIHFY